MTNERSPKRATVASFLAVVILAALVIWVTQAIVAHNKLQNCLDSGRRDCLPIDTGGSRP